MKCPPRLPGCGTQHPHRALGGTRILLAAAPTTPPCFRHWRRSSSLQRKNFFDFGVLKSLRAFRNPFFTGGVATVNGSCCACFLRKQSRCGKAFAGFQWAEPSQALPRQLPQRGSQAVNFDAKVLSVMREFPAVLLALPLGELSPQVTERARAVRL